MPNLIKHCLRCGKEVIVPNFPSKRERTKFCSRSCATFYHNHFGKFNTKGYKYTEEQKQRMRKPHELTEKFMAAQKLRGLKHRGSNNHLFTGKIHKARGIRWIEWLAIRQLILERDNFKCQKCGKTHHEVLLDVHHIKPLRNDGSNEQSNLVTLCRSCHKITEYELIRGEHLACRV